MSLSSAGKSLEHECIQLAEKVAALRGAALVDGDNDQPNSSEALQSEILKVLMYEGNILTEKTVKAPVSNHLLAAYRFNKELESVISQSKHICKTSLHQVEELRRRVDGKEVLVTEQNSLHTRIQECSDVAVSEDHKGTKKDFAGRYKAELQEAKDSQVQQRKAYEQKMKDFLAQEFPNNTGDVNGTKYLSLEGIIMDLMVRARSNTEDPYLLVTDVIWPPYLELLLRHNICCRHPVEANRIKLACVGS